MLKSDGLLTQYFDYVRDSMERSILFLDILRQRGNNHLEQCGRTAPHALNFDFRLLVDGRKLPRPVNYGLVEIVPPNDIAIDPQERPFIIFDPRAGHGPGIGGMKHDSEIGVALRAGHPCYLVGFLPHPEQGQTIEDVCRAEAHFVQVVSQRHQNADGKPVLIGNCQAGWQILMMAAMEPSLPGPVLVAGTPLSYWAGVRGKYPMRYLGGLLGGTWLTWLISDLGCGIFDGAWLISNFEFNNPANTFWKKGYNVYANVDTEAKRFLDFEKWWGSPVLLNAEEIEFIVDELFVGNKLSAGKIVATNGERIDLRKIKSPIVVFCSFGDDITPPQQALDWILDLYQDRDEIVANGQTIIYSLHESIGHLGIFVSGKVAKKEHEEFTFNMSMIDVMPPGLYELVLADVDETIEHPELVEGKYTAKLQPRTLDDIRALGHNDNEDQRRFETVVHISDINQGMYRTFMQPFIKCAVTPKSAEFLRERHPNRVAFRAYSDRNPMMAQVASTAEKIRSNRHPAEQDNPFLACEKMASAWIVTNLEIVATIRDAMMEATFLNVYGAPLLQASVGLKAEHATGERNRFEPCFVRTDLEAKMERGGFLEGAFRALLYVLRGQGADERQFNALETLRNSAPQNERVPRTQVKDMIREQAALLRLDEAMAVASIPKIMPEDPSRRAKVLSTIYNIISADGEPDPGETEKYREICRLFERPNMMEQTLSASVGYAARRSL